MNSFKLTDFILQKNVIPVELCSELIDLTKTDHWQQHQWYDVKVNESRSYDKELDVLFPDPVLTNKLFEIVVGSFAEYFVDVCKPLHSQINFTQTINSCCGIRMNRYSEGTLMKPHFDHIHSLFDGSQKGIPVLSMIGILNDDYQGGDLVFFDDYKVETKVGDLIIFPSSFLYPHAIKEVTKGTRYSFVSWAW